MTDYKKTLNIPVTSFPMKANLSLNASKYLSFWEENKIYERWREKNKGGEVFVLHDGPPYANGNIHLGHALNKVLKDFICRYWMSKGKFVEYIPGWDTHGLPIENKMEKTISHYNSKTIIEKRRYCREYATTQLNLQKSQFKKLNLLSPFTTTYLTFSPEYISNEYKVLLKLFSQNAIIWSLKPVFWSWSSKTALAESEIIYKNIEETSIYFYFEVSVSVKNLPSKINFLLWTTTPYTLEANKALTLSPNITYTLILYNQEYFLLAKSRLQILNELFGWEDIENIGEYKGDIFEYSTYINPLTTESGIIILADYVTDNTGTGIVHNAPGFGMEDYLSSLKYQLEIYCPINESGYFIETPKFNQIASKFYTEASHIVIEYLKSTKYLLKTEKINHSVGHDWRTNKPLLYRATKQWFLDLEPIKTKAKSSFSPLSSSPSWLGPKLLSSLKNRAEWCLSRQRAWGVPFPIIFADNEPILKIEQLSYTIDLLNKYGVDSWYEKPVSFFLHPSFSEGKKYTKSTDILDVWFDSGTSWMNIEEENKVAEIYLEGFDQTRGWFNSSAITSLLYRGKLPFKNLLGHGFILDEKGNKMSKSLGNVVDPLEIIDKFGADILRLWIAKSNYLEDLKFGTESLTETINLYRKIRNTLLRYPLSILTSFNQEKIIFSALKYTENKYIIAYFGEIYEKIEEALKEYNFSTVILNISLFLKVYSNWYLEITKEILYCSSKKSPHYLEISAVIAEIFSKSLYIFSIFLPQTAEETYEYMEKENKKKSVFLEDWDCDISYSPTKNPAIKSILTEFKDFLSLKNEIYIKTEGLKAEGKIAGSWEASIEISGDLVKDFTLSSLPYLLNIASIEINPNISNTVLSSPTSLPICLRCKKHKDSLVLTTENICNRCHEVINNS